MTLFSQMWQVVQHFILAFVQNPNPCRKYATLSVSVISSVTTKLGDPNAITNSTHLFNTVLNSSCHGGHLKIGGSKCILISWARHCWVGRFHHWDTCDITSVLVEPFHSSFDTQSLCSEFPIASVGPSKHSELTVLRCSTIGCVYVHFF